ncbi:MAG: glycosyltransferase family 2 protein [Solirubrobacteraceae bacterium]|nr:glycosyltransferase family 2 protein [Solirubrobacteraceae bacterium]
MAPTACIAIPTQGRPGQLDTALASIAPQAAARGVEIIVVDDGPSDATREAAARHGATYLLAGPPVRASETTRGDRGGDVPAPAAPAHYGPNAARNRAFAATEAELVILLDDDIRAADGWLDALLDAHASEPDDVAVLAGRIIPWLDPAYAPRTCGRHGSWVTELDVGDEPKDIDNGWSANMGVRRTWLNRVGTFDEAHAIGGDEEEWTTRIRAAGGRVRYLPAASVRHERIGEDASLRRLARAARFRGRNLRLFDAQQGRAPGLPEELRRFFGSLAHAMLRRCPMGLVLAAHSYGRLEQTLLPKPPPARPGLTDFLSGRSGHVAGKRGQLLRAADALLDALRAPITAIEQLRARRLPKRRVLAVAIARDPADFAATIAPHLTAGHHDVELDVQPLDARGKYQRLTAMLAAHDLASYDHVLLVDDDVDLPAGFMDRFLWAVERAGLVLAQPAHRRHSHAAWPVTRRRLPHAARRTHFVEIGPITLMRAPALAQLVPFPEDLGMGWGLDVHWGALAREAGWPIGVVDSTPLLHRHPVAGGYGREEVVEQARAFLAERPYVTRDEAAWSEPAAPARRAGR